MGAGPTLRKKCSSDKTCCTSGIDSGCTHCDGGDPTSFDFTFPSGLDAQIEACFGDTCHAGDGGGTGPIDGTVLTLTGPSGINPCVYSGALCWCIYTAFGVDYCVLVSVQFEFFHDHVLAIVQAYNNLTLQWVQWAWTAPITPPIDCSSTLSLSWTSAWVIKGCDQLDAFGSLVCQDCVVISGSNPGCTNSGTCCTIPSCSPSDPGPPIINAPITPTWCGCLATTLNPNDPSDVAPVATIDFGNWLESNNVNTGCGLLPHGEIDLPLGPYVINHEECTWTTYIGNFPAGSYCRIQLQLAAIACPGDESCSFTGGSPKCCCSAQLEVRLFDRSVGRACNGTRYVLWVAYPIGPYTGATVSFALSAGGAILIDPNACCTPIHPPPDPITVNLHS